MPRKTGRILIVDDNEQILNSLKLLLKQDFEHIVTARNPGTIHSLMISGSFDVILLDMNFKAGDHSGNEGIFWLNEIMKHDPQAVVILITAYGEIELAVKAIKKGATDFITKPWDANKLIVTIKNALSLRKSKTEVQTLKVKQNHLNSDIDKLFRIYRGSSPSMAGIYRTIEKISKTDANVLLLGENGTGKELIAREIHRNSLRSSEIFLSVDMAALNEGIFESELFGHIKGSYTDAKEDRVGRFEAASGGTLFLDEIGNLSMLLQSKLLTVLQNRQITRLGSNKPVDVDIRLISATNKNIGQMVQNNTFREDLLFRINTITIELPPLRNRTEDIPGLANFFLKHFTSHYNKPGLKFSLDAYDKLLQYSWPGNIRELKHTVEKAVILSETGLIAANDLFLTNTTSSNHSHFSSNRLSDVEKEIIERVVRQCKGNLSKAAEILDISRTTLYSKIEKYGLN